MLGAIIGDVIGSVHEGAGTKTKSFPLFTEWSIGSSSALALYNRSRHWVNGKRPALAMPNLP
jgi:hypothetical protein